MKNFNCESRIHVKRQQGFTLIELVTVIVILGILSVVAAPRFINFSRDAHLSVFNATFSAFKSAMESHRLLWLTRGSPVGNDALNLSDNIDFNQQGYPSGIDDGTQVSTPQDCLDIFNSVLDTDLIAAVSIGDGQGIKNLPQNVDVAVTNNANICYYTFVSESKEIGYNARQFRYLYTTGQVIKFASGYTLQ
ncbi:type II secretion system protein [Shewanella sp. 202IG2-18]|uniref:type II secretion system protein n=1 Tax=Parashewanella hymeniacidonis TaxID=2807618 RepID=UPI001961CBC3|nr:type II secretion system protein [Parashewanella hymeniacidonis]MBM7074164.1 type II secretion system protein [Parashewanella hymeniacidonis]